MAYLKQWAPRAHNDLELRVPELIAGRGPPVRGDATELVDTLPRVDLAYLDPPYNQHRYFTNYHVWETLVALGRARALRRRVQADRQPRRQHQERVQPEALDAASAPGRARCGPGPTCVVVSYNDESWITAEQMTDWLREAGHEDVRMLAFDSKRYVGAQIGVYNPSGQQGRQGLAPAQHRVRLRRRQHRPGRVRDGRRPRHLARRGRAALSVDGLLRNRLADRRWSSLSRPRCGCGLDKLDQRVVRPVGARHSSGGESACGWTTIGRSAPEHRAVGRA